LRVFGRVSGLLWAETGTFFHAMKRVCCTKQKQAGLMGPPVYMNMKLQEIFLARIIHEL
jgi:hypothetical protein